MAKQRITVTNQIRKAILMCGMSRYAIAKQTGIGADMLCRFVHGERGLSSENTDKLCAFLGLELRPIRQKGR